MGPNDAEVVRVYTRRPKAAIADITFTIKSDFEVVVEAETGDAKFAGGGSFATGIVVKDLTANDNIKIDSVSGQLAKEWTTLDQAFTYKVGNGSLAGRDGHLCQVYAHLLMGVQNHDASFATSPVFMLLP